MIAFVYLETAGDESLGIVEWHRLHSCRNLPEKNADIAAKKNLLHGCVYEVTRNQVQLKAVFSELISWGNGAPIGRWGSHHIPLF